MKEIPLTKGYVTQVDDDDFEWLNQWKWCTAIRDKRIYAVSRIGGRTLVYMHRLILGLTDSKIHVDHHDLNGLNNQRFNLRQSTKSQNGCNRGLDKRSQSGHKGVSWHSQMKKWRAYIVVNYKQKSLGLFNDPIEAAKAYDRAAEELHGEFARLNFPEEQHHSL